MGYTVYWTRTDEPITQGFVDEVKEVIKKSIEKGISIRGWDGTGEPTITKEYIRFNGNAELDLDHETFALDSIDDKFGFCKTARKPYDWTVKKILKIAEEYGLVTEVSDDGNCEFVTDKEYLGEETTLLYDLLKKHAGHRVEIAEYGDGANFALEDIDTNEVIFDTDGYDLIGKEN